MSHSGKIMVSYLAIVTLCFIALFISSAGADAQTWFNLTIDDPIEGQTVKGAFLITGTMDPGSETDWDNVQVDINGTWHECSDTSANGTWETWEYLWRSGHVENGNWTLSAAVGRGFDQLNPITVNITTNNKDPEVYISKVRPPVLDEGTILRLNAEVNKTGSGTYIMRWEWYSSIDGKFGKEQNVTVFLSPGTHTITMVAMSDAGAWSDVHTTSVTVNEIESWGLHGGALTHSGYTKEDLDPTQMGFDWFYRTGKRDYFNNLVEDSEIDIMGMVVGDGVLFLALEDGNVIAMDGDGGKDGLEGKAVDGADILWSHNLGSELSGAIAYWNETLIVGTMDGFIYALDGIGNDDGTTDRKWNVTHVETGWTISDNAFTIVDGYLVFGTYSGDETEGEIRTVLISDGTPFDTTPRFNGKPIHRPITVGDYLLQPIQRSLEGCVVYDIEANGQINLLGNLTVDGYVTAASAYRGRLVVITQPIIDNSSSIIYLFNYALELQAQVHTALDYYTPVSFNKDLIIAAGVFNENYTGQQGPYEYEKGYLQFFDPSLTLLHEHKMNGTPSASATVNDEFAFVTTDNGTMYAFNMTGATFDGYPINITEYSMGDLGLSNYRTTQLIPYNGSLIFATQDKAVYSMGRGPARPYAKLLDVNPPDDNDDPIEAYNGQVVRFYGGGFSYPGLNITSFFWESDLEAEPLGDEKNFTGKLGTGNHTISLTVWDDLNVSSVPFSFLYVVNPNGPPVVGIANLDEILKVDVNEVMKMDLSTSSDPDGDDIDFIIDWGDGSLVFKAPGFIKAHAYKKAGNYVISITPVDEHGVAGEVYTLEIKAVQKEKDEDESNLICLIIILLLILFILLLITVYIKVKRTAPEAEEEEVEEEELPSTPPPKPKVKKRKTVKQAIAPPPPAPEPDLPPIGLDSEDISMEELEERLRALMGHKRELEEMVDEEEK